MTKPKHTKYSTSFIVMPDQCNAMFPMIFGGALWSQLDLAAAVCVKRALYDSPCNSAVTHKSDVTFHDASELGNIIFIDAEIVELRRKAIVIDIVAYKETPDGQDTKTKIADAKFVFVSKIDNRFAPHGLELKD